jgi:hypothetical protein
MPWVWQRRAGGRFLRRRSPHPHPAIRPGANSRGHIRPAMITQQTAEPGQQQAGRAVAASGRRQRGRRAVVRMARPAATLAFAGRAER